MQEKSCLIAGKLSKKCEFPVVLGKNLSFSALISIELQIIYGGFDERPDFPIRFRLFMVWMELYLRGNQRKGPVST